MSFTFAPLAEGFDPTGEYFLILAGPYRGQVGEAYKFLTWGGVSIRISGHDLDDLAVYSLEQVHKINYDLYDKLRAV